MINLAIELENILKAATAASVTNYFIWIIFVFLVISLVFAMLGWWKTMTSYTPGLLTSLGILGTFIGIVIGLLEFDANDIDGSIENLLGGLRTAFITSLVGMGSAIFYKIIGSTPIFAVNRTYQDWTDFSPEPEDFLKEIKGQNEHLVDIKKSIAGEEESSLVGQVKLLRGDMNDKFNKHEKEFEKFSSKLWEEMNQFAEMLSKSATEQVIEALNSVITDFNKNLKEQFGENFKQLNEAVLKLVEWQENYKQQIADMVEQYSQGVTAIDNTNQSVSNINESVVSIKESTSSIPETMNNLQTIIQTNQNQLQELGNHLQAFAEMKEQAVKAIPATQEHVKKIIDDISNSSSESTSAYNSLVESTRQFISTQQESLRGSLETQQNAINSMVEESVQKTEEMMNKELSAIDESMQTELHRVINEMGQALARITGQFAQDYSKLVTAMSQVVNRQI